MLEEEDELELLEELELLLEDDELEELLEEDDVEDVEELLVDEPEESDELPDEGRLLHPSGGSKKYGIPISGSGVCGMRFHSR